MKLKEIVTEAAQPSVVETVKKALGAVMVRHARMDSLNELEDNRIAFDVEFEFPEHLVKSSEVKKAGKPFVQKVSVEKGEMWKEGVSGAAYVIDLTNPLGEDEAKELKAFVKKEFKPDHDNT